MKNEFSICDFADNCLLAVRVIVVILCFGFLVGVVILGMRDVCKWVEDAANATISEELEQDIVYPGAGIGRAEGERNE